MQRDIAQIDDQAAQSARDVDREMSTSSTQADRLVEMQLRDRRRTRRQGEDVERAGPQLVVAPAG
jgi:hypothetical protein